MAQNELIEVGQILLVNPNGCHLNRYATLLRKVDQVEFKSKLLPYMEHWEVEFEDGTRRVTGVFTFRHDPLTGEILDDDA